MEGFTSLTWVLLGAASQKLSISPTVSMPIFGTLCGASVVALAFWAARRGRHGARGAGLLAATFLVASTDLTFYSVSGLETSLFTLLVLASAVAALDKRPWVFVAVASAAALTRPEGAFSCLFGAAVLGFLIGKKRTARNVVAPLAIVAGLLLVFRWLTFHALLPNTFYAKQPQLDVGLDYFVQALPWVIPVWMLPIAGLVLRRGRITLYYFAAGAAWLAIGVAEGGDWMRLHRMFVPAIPLLAIAADRAFGDLEDRLPRARIAITLTAVSAFLIVNGFRDQNMALRAELMARSDDLRRELIESLTASRTILSVGTYDIGLIGWLLPDVRVLDLGGLTDPMVARSTTVYWDKIVPEPYLVRHAPDVFLFTTHVPPERAPDGRGVSIVSIYAAERRIQALPFFRREYLFAGSFDAGVCYLHVFTRRETTPTD